MKFLKNILLIIGTSLLWFSCQTFNKGGNKNNAKIWKIIMTE